MFRKTLIASLAAAVLLASPGASQTMTKAEEEQITRAFDMTMQGQDLFYSGRFAEAETVFAEVLDLMENGVNPSPLSIASALHNLAASIAQQGRLLEAESLARRALDLREKNGAVDNALVGSWELLATILLDLNRHTEARGYQSMVVDRTLNGEDVDPTGLVRSVATLAYLTALDGYVGDAIAIANQLVPMIDQMRPEDQAPHIEHAGPTVIHERTAKGRRAVLPASRSDVSGNAGIAGLVAEGQGDGSRQSRFGPQRPRTSGRGRKHFPAGRHDVARRRSDQFRDICQYP